MFVFKTPQPYNGESWGFDNGAFSYWRNGRQFDEDGYRRRLDKAEKIGVPYMAIVPDMVAGGIVSLEFSEQWFEKLPNTWPWYLAVQDGMEILHVEPILGKYSGIFLGGTLRFKSTALKWCEMAHRRGKRFHYGRCGTPKRVEHARFVGSDSLDSSFPLWTKERMSYFIDSVENGHPQKDLFF